MWTKLVLTQKKLRTTLMQQYKQGAIANACAKMVGLPPPSTMSINDDVLGQSMFNAMKTGEVGNDILKNIERVADGVMIGQEMHAAGATPFEIMWNVLPNVFAAGTGILSAGLLIDKFKDRFKGNAELSEYVTWFTAEGNRSLFEQAFADLGVQFRRDNVGVMLTDFINVIVPHLVKLRDENRKMERDRELAVEFLTRQQKPANQETSFQEFVHVLFSPGQVNENRAMGLLKQQHVDVDGKVLQIMLYWLKETIQTFSALARIQFKFERADITKIIEGDKTMTEMIQAALRRAPRVKYSEDNCITLLQHTFDENIILRWLIAQAEKE